MKKLSKVMLIAIIAVSLVTFTACAKNGNNENLSQSVTVQYVADGGAAATLIAGGKVDYIVVGEPAATLQKGKQSLNAEMDLQKEYSLQSGVATFPQAGIFVKTAVAQDESFMTAFFALLANNKSWITTNSANVTAEAKRLYESAVFPANSISRCAIDATKIDKTGKDEVITFLKNVMNNDSKGNVIDWDSAKSNLFDYYNANPLDKNTSIRLSAPEGTPALSILTLASNNTLIDGHNVDYQIVSPSNIASEMKTAKSDIVIMPVNAGANLIKQGADYKLVSVAVDGSLFLIGKGTNPTITMDDLAGKTIACIGKNGVPDLIFRYILSANNLEIKEV